LTGSESEDAQRGIDEVTDFGIEDASVMRDAENLLGESVGVPSLNEQTGHDPIHERREIDAGLQLPHVPTWGGMREIRVAVTRENRADKRGDNEALPREGVAKIEPEILERRTVIVRAVQSGVRPLAVVLGLHIWERHAEGGSVSKPIRGVDAQGLTVDGPAVDSTCWQLVIPDERILNLDRDGSFSLR